MVQVHFHYKEILVDLQVLILQQTRQHKAVLREKQTNQLDTMLHYNMQLRKEQLQLQIMNHLYNQFILMHYQLVLGVVKMMKLQDMVLLRLQLNQRLVLL